MELRIEKGAPLKLPDGTVLLPKENEYGEKLISREMRAADKELAEACEDPLSSVPADAYVRTLADVTVGPKKMNSTMIVLAYAMWGLNRYAISHLVNASVDQVTAIQESDLYQQLRRDMVDAIRFAETASIHGYLANEAMQAARVMAAALKNKDPDTRMAAAKDILDRTGFRPVDRTEHVHRFEDELRIVHLTDSPQKHIDLEL